MILNQPWKYSYEEEKFSSGGGGGPWTLPNLSMISWWVFCEFVYNFQLGNTITNTRYICRAFPPIVQQEFMQSAVRCLSSLSKLSVKKTTMRQKLAKFQALKSTLQCTVYVHTYIHIYAYIFMCAHTCKHTVCIFVILLWPHLATGRTKHVKPQHTQTLNTHAHIHNSSSSKNSKNNNNAHSFIHSLTHLQFLFGIVAVIDEHLQATIY